MKWAVYILKSGAASVGSANPTDKKRMTFDEKWQAERYAQRINAHWRAYHSNVNIIQGEIKSFPHAQY